MTARLKTKAAVIRRITFLVVLVAITGLLVLGGIHRTQAVLASEGGGGSGTYEFRQNGDGTGGGHRGGGSGGGE